jgi:hypothetical protein
VKPVVTESAPAAPATPENPSAEKPSEGAELHKRTQNKLVDEALSTFANLTPEAVEELTKEVEQRIKKQLS